MKLRHLKAVGFFLFSMVLPMCNTVVAGMPVELSIWEWVEWGSGEGDWESPDSWQDVICGTYETPLADGTATLNIERVEEDDNNSDKVIRINDDYDNYVDRGKSAYLHYDTLNIGTEGKNVKILHANYKMWLDNLNIGDADGDSIAEYAFTSDGAIPYAEDNVYDSDNGTYRTIGNDRAFQASYVQVGITGRGKFTVKDAISDKFSILTYLHVGVEDTGIGEVILENSEIYNNKTILSPEYTVYSGMSSMLAGLGGNGVISQVGGEVSADYMQLGVNSLGSGSYYLKDNGIFYGSSINIGVSGIGYMQQDSGKVILDFISSGGNGILTLGKYANSDGAYVLNGGDIYSNGMVVGQLGTASFTQYGGLNWVGAPNYFHPQGRDGASLFVGKGSAQDRGVGIYKLYGGTLKSYNEYIGVDFNPSNNSMYVYGKEGKFYQYGGYNSVVHGMYIGRNSFYELNGGTLDAESIDVFGGAKFSQFEGISNISAIGLDSPMSSRLAKASVSGGVMNISQIYLDGYSSVSHDGGTVNIQRKSTGGLGNIRIEGMYSLISNYSISSGAVLNGWDGTIDIYGGGVFSQSGGIVNIDTITTYMKNEPSTVTHCCEGRYMFSGGELYAGNIVNNGGFIFTGGKLSVKNFQGDLKMNNGVLAPGHSPGITTIDGNFVMNGGILDIEIAGLNDFDVINVLGKAKFADGELHITFIDNFVPSEGDMFRFFTATDGIDNFDLLDISTFNFDNRFTWRIISGVDNGISYNAFKVNRQGQNSTPVPEPAGIILLVSGLGFFLKKKF